MLMRYQMPEGGSMDMIAMVLSWLRKHHFHWFHGWRGCPGNPFRPTDSFPPADA
jgi:hypothetical protein